jgi:hypothetical protein
VASLKRKKDLAELKVAADLVDRGCSISFPFGEDCDYGLELYPKSYGASGARTRDLGIANAALFQLSYGPSNQIVGANLLPLGKALFGRADIWREGLLKLRTH